MIEYPKIGKISSIQKLPEEMFYKMGALKNFSKFKRKHLISESLLWLKFQVCGVFLWILQNFQERLFYRTPPRDYFWILTRS